MSARMPKSWVVALGLTLATYSDVSAAPRSVRVFPAALRATTPPPPRAEAARIVALLDRDHAAEPAIEIAARWTREAPYGQAAIVGDRVVWLDDNKLRALSLQTGALVPQADIQWPPERRIAQFADSGGALVVSLAGSGTGTTELLALAVDGTTRWRTELPGRAVDLRSAGKALFAFEIDPTVWRLDPRSGRTLWSRPSDQAIVDVVALSDDLAAVVRPDDILLLDSASGGVLSTRRRNPHVAAFTVRDSRLFSCVDDGTLHATDVPSGRELWWARVSTANGECAVFGATDDSVLVEGAGRLMALDTTRAAPRAPALTISGRFKDLYSDKPKLRGRAVHVGDRRVRTDARGRFVATVRAHGPIEVSVDDAGSSGRAIVWPDGHARQHVELSNYVDDSCH
jgi:outer membrane protein assembly factor BamB